MTYAELKARRDALMVLDTRTMSYAQAITVDAEIRELKAQMKFAK